MSTLLEMIVVMQAANKETKIQVKSLRSSSPWRNVAHGAISWDWSKYEYRIAPAPPRRFSLTFEDDIIISAIEIETSEPVDGTRIVEVEEILE